MCIALADVHLHRVASRSSSKAQRKLPNLCACALLTHHVPLAHSLLLPAVYVYVFGYSDPCDLPVAPGAGRSLLGICASCAPAALRSAWSAHPWCAGAGSHWNSTSSTGQMQAKRQYSCHCMYVCIQRDCAGHAAVSTRCCVQGVVPAQQMRPTAQHTDSS
jgi:hypothetical protein